MKGLRYLWMPALFILVALLSLAHAQRLAAQSTGSISGTGSNGTIPSSAIYLPLVANQTAPTPAPTYAAIPIAGAPIDRPAHIHGDLNLSLRSYVSTTAELTLVDIEGHTDVNAPQLADIFTPARLPQFSAVYQVHDCDGCCDSDGCRGAALTALPATLLGMATIV